MMSDELGLILPPGLGQPAIYEPFNGLYMDSAAAVSANAVYLLRGRLDVSKVLSSMSVDIFTTAVGNIDLGWYLISGSNYVRQDHAGPTAIGGSTTVQTIAQILARPVPAGVDFWLGVGSDTNPTIARFVSIARINAIGAKCVSIAGAYSSGLPSTISIASTAGSALSPWLAAHLS